MAASSSDVVVDPSPDIPSGSGAKCATAEKAHAPSIVLEAVPHVECISLDRIGGCGAVVSYVLTNTITAESHVLPAGYWSIEYCDVSGSSVVYSEPDDDAEPVVLDVDACFTKVAYKHPSGELFMQEGSARVQSWDAARSRHKAATLKMTLGASTASAELEAFVFDLAREANQRIYIPAHQLYTVLGLGNFKGVKSTWIARGRARRQARLEGMIGCGLMLSSTHGNAKIKMVSDAAAWRAHCVPSLSISTLGFRLLLVRFAFTVRAKGGIQTEQPRLAAQDVLRSLVSQSLCSKEPLQIPLEWGASWRCVWPRPQPLEQFPCSVQLREGGELTFDELAHVATGPHRNPCATAWWKELQKLLGRFTTKVRLWDLLERCAASTVLAPLLAQLLWPLSLIVEAFFIGQATHPAVKQGSADRVVCAWQSIGDIYGKHMKHRVAQYTLACVEASFGQHCMTMATDKGTIAGLPLQTTVVGLQHNAAIICVPQVAQTTGIKCRHE